jgi:hypothetical protein
MKASELRDIADQCFAHWESLRGSRDEAHLALAKEWIGLGFQALRESQLANRREHSEREELNLRLAAGLA